MLYKCTCEQMYSCLCIRTHVHKFTSDYFKHNNLLCEYHLVGELKTNILLISSPMPSVCRSDTITMFYEFNRISTLQLPAIPVVVLVLNFNSAYVH